MRVIAISTVRNFWAHYPDSEQHLKSWLDEARKASWRNPQEVKVQYRNASILKSNRVVFNIKGNEYRLIVAITYRFQAIYIKFIGTHAQYDAVNADTVEME